MAKKAKSKRASEKVPRGYIRGDDGKLYKKRVIAGTVAIALSADIGKAAQERNARVEAAMNAAIMTAHNEGITDPVKIRERIVAARDEALKTD